MCDLGVRSGPVLANAKLPHLAPERCAAGCGAGAKSVPPSPRRLLPDSVRSICARFLGQTLNAAAAAFSVCPTFSTLRTMSTRLRGVVRAFACRSFRVFLAWMFLLHTLLSQPGLGGTTS